MSHFGKHCDFKASRQQKGNKRRHALKAVTLMCAMSASNTAIAENASSGTIYNFNIVAGEMSGALNKLAETANVELSYPSATASDMKSNGLKGNYTIEQALQQLLKGSGLNYRVADGNSITVEKVTVVEANDTTYMPAVKVTATVSHEPEIDTSETYKITNSRTATKTDTSLMETPFSVQAVTQEVINDQQSIRVEDALKNISNVQTTVPNGGQYDGFVVRGFSQTTLFKDGFRFPSKDSIGIGPRDLSNIDHIEVLKGPASLLYGRIEPGGMINLVTKKPLEAAHYSLQQQIGSFDHYRTVVDATGPVNNDKSLLYRVDLGYETSNSFIDFNGTDRVSVSPRLRWKPTDDTQFDLEYQHLQGDVTPSTSVPAMTVQGGRIIGNRPLALDRSFFKGEKYNGHHFNEDMVDFNWSHSFNKDWKINQRFSYDHATNANASTLGFIFKPNLVDLLRRETDVHSAQDTFSTNLDLTGNFKAFGVMHTLLAGGDYYHSDMQEAYNSIYPFQLGGNLLNVYNPIHNSIRPTFDSDKAKLTNLIHDWFGLYLQDQIQLPFDFQLLAGMRYDEAWVSQNTNIRNSDDGVIGITQINNKTGVVKPRVGLVWHPIKEFSLFGNYVENLGSTALTSIGSTFKPEESQQWEVGAKTELMKGRLTATLAYFELGKQNTPVPYLDTGLTRPIGAAKSQGIELDISGEILPNWNVIASYAHVNTEIIKDASYLVGNQLSNVPRNSGSLWNTYYFKDEFLKGFKLGAGVVARGQRQGDPENSFQLPGYVTLGLMTGYEFRIGKTKLLTQFNVDNLLDKYYFSESGGFRGGAVYGAPRSYMGTVRVEF
jgi:iron complex outermembrane receptor protein